MTAPTAEPQVRDPREPIGLLTRDLRCGVDGLSTREAQRRLVVYGPNELSRRAGSRGWRQLAAQFTHPLAVLLWLAAGLAVVAGTVALSVAIVVVIVVNAVFAFVQEQHAEKAVEALAAYLPPRAAVVRDGIRQTIDARSLVPGDVMIVEEGDRVSADARLISGGVEVDLSTINGESLPAYRSPDRTDLGGPLLDARDLVFSGTNCTGGEARALVFATGMRTELKCAGLDAEQLARRSVPPSTMSLLGLVRHLSDVERAWFRRTMAGLDSPRLYRGAHDDDDFDGADADSATVAAAWRTRRSECAFTDGYIARAASMDVPGDHHGRVVSLREVVIHLVEEYARHNGHADLLRERIDGRVGE